MSPSLQLSQKAEKKLYLHAAKYITSDCYGIFLNKVFWLEKSTNKKYLLKIAFLSFTPVS